MDNVLLKAPKWSVFPNGERRVTSLRAGKITPVYFNLLGTGEQISLQHNLLLRLAPMLTPAMADIECDVDFFAVPFGVLYGIDIYDDFIVDGNNFGADLPELSFENNTPLSQYFLSGTLLDYLNLPNRIGFYNDFLSGIINGEITYNNNTITFFEWSSAAIGFSYGGNSVTSVLVFSRSGSLPALRLNLSASEGYYSSLRPLLGYCANYYYNGSFVTNAPVVTIPSLEDFLVKFPTLDKFVSEVGFRTVNNLFDSLIPELFDVFIDEPSLRSDRYSISNQIYSAPGFFTDSYHKVISDWYLNTQVVDPDTYLSLRMTNKATEHGLTGVAIKLFDRFYPDDYFTGCVPNSQVGSAVQIPADTTVLELANLTALQRMLLRSGYVGTKRFKDFARGFFGVNPSNQKLMFSEFIGRKTYRVQINDVAQTSQSTSESVLASYSGRGISWGKNGGFKYYADVPTCILGLASVRAKTLYNGVVDPFVKVKKTSDFILPDLESVGNEAIYLDELTGLPGDSDTVFAWNRRYYRWTRRPSVVTGAMRTYLNYWNISRNTLFEKPVYNQDWLTIHPEDGFDNVFGVSDVDNIYCDFRFDVKVSRPLSKYLHLHI